jgi:hypothetical protein
MAAHRINVSSRRTKEVLMTEPVEFRIEEVTPRELEDASMGRALLCTLFLVGAQVLLSPEVVPPDRQCSAGSACTDFQQRW